MKITSESENAAAFMGKPKAFARDPETREEFFFTGGDLISSGTERVCAAFFAEPLVR